MTEDRGTLEGAFERFRIHNPAGPDFVFEGEKLAEASSSELGTVRIYRTRGGKWVASQAHEVMRANPNLFRAAVLKTDEDLVEWLGPTKSGKALAEAVGLKVTVWID